jgi:hypothetical protein
MGINRASRRLAVLVALLTAVLVGNPVSAAQAGTVTHAGPTQAASIKCDNTPPDCDPDVCFCPVW